MLFHDQQSTCKQSGQSCEQSEQSTYEQSTTAHQLDNPLHHWLEYSTVYSTLDSSSHKRHIATSWRQYIIIIMSDHIGPVIKKIRDFNVKYYPAWAIEAREALEERGGMRWIDPATPTKEIKEEDEIDIVDGLRAKALLSHSIGYELKNRVRDCTAALEFWSGLEDEFAYKSREDEQRFKALLSQIHKTNTEDLDTFIAWFDELAAQARNAISDPLCRLDSININSAFLNALEYSDIPGEDWGMFPTRIGDEYLTTNPCQIYADTRIYYSSHFVHKRLEQATAAAIAAATAAAAAASIKPIAVGLDEDSLWVFAIDNHDNRDNRTMRGPRRGRRRGRGLQRKEYPTDPDGCCTFHRRVVHTTEQCRARLQPPTTHIQCYNCNKFGHKSPHCPERNRYAPSSVPTPPPRGPAIQLQAPPRIQMIRTPTGCAPI
jgi:hypothetical protein